MLVRRRCSSIRIATAPVTAAVFLLASAAVHEASAQPAPGGPGGPGGPAGDSMSQLLQQNPNGGPQLVSGVRGLPVCSPGALDAIMKALAGANAEQKAAIGSGLAQAARVNVRTNAGCATQIQEAVVRFNDQVVTLS